MRNSLLFMVALMASVNVFSLEPKKPSDFVRMVAEETDILRIDCKNNSGSLAIGYKFRMQDGEEYIKPKGKVFVLESVAWQVVYASSDISSQGNTCLWINDNPSGYFGYQFSFFNSCGSFVEHGPYSWFSDRKDIRPGAVVSSSDICVFITPEKNNGVVQRPSQFLVTLYGYFAKDQ